MSTKIYTGFITDLDLLAFREHVFTMQDKFNEFIKKDYARVMANLIVSEVDRDAAENKFDPAKDYMSVAYHNIMDRQRKIEKTQERDPCVDWSFEVAVCPLTNGKLVGIYFCDNRDMSKIWTEEDCISDYSYWNNVDPDENCTKEEWEQREKDWDEVLSKCSVPAEVMFTIKVTEQITYFFSGFEDVKQLVKEELEKKDFEMRVTNKATDKFLDEYIKKYTEEQGIDTINSTNLSVCFDGHRAGKKYLETDEGKAELEKKKDEFRTLLLTDVAGLIDAN